MSAKAEPWYIHAILYVVIVVLVYVLIRVAILDPSEVIERQTYVRDESRARMLNLREAQIMWEDRFGKFTDNLDSLINFIATDSLVAEKMTGIDSLTQRSTNPFKPLVSGPFNTDSLYLYPGNGLRYIMQVDTNSNIDTIINRRGTIVKIDTSIVIGTRYVIFTPDSTNKDKIGDKFSDALKNAASWE